MLIIYRADNNPKKTLFPYEEFLRDSKHFSNLVSIIYVHSLQSFGIPGPYPLSILIGALLGPIKGFVTC